MTNPSLQNLETETKHNSEVFAVHGRHIAQLDQAGKIANLKVELLTGDRLATPIT